MRIFSSYNQDDWSDRLPVAEFAYNTSSHSATTMTPFFANKGYKPTLEIAFDKAVNTPFELDACRLHLIHKHCKQEAKPWTRPRL